MTVQNDTTKEPENTFLPLSPAEAAALGWDEVDFVLVCGDAYVDHPSFGAAVIGRVLQAAGYRVGLLPQPDVSSPDSFKVFGEPRLAVLISGGVVDSMVAHYTVAKRRRTFDEYSPGGRPGKRPDRAIDVYTGLAKRAFPQKLVVIGGVEASLRRFAHYDYWDDAVRPSILETSGADLVSYGMGEHSIRAIAAGLAAGKPIEALRGTPGTAHLCEFADLPPAYAECAGLARVRADKRAYAKACAIQMDNQDPLTAKPLVQRQTRLYLVQSPPAPPLDGAALDAVFALPFARQWHPAYDAAGGVPALEEVKFSLIHNRGCFGGCNFCAITLHQGRRVTARSAASLVAEAEALTRLPDFKGYIHDVGGPTANFRVPSCKKQLNKGMCAGGKHCLAPSPCANLKASHVEYLAILRRLRGLSGVKRVFIRSGIRYDYLLCDEREEFFRELVAHHVSGQLKVAPEHCAPAVLKAMGKPSIATYERFAARFAQLSQQAGKEQYLVPYLISSHPGSTLADAVALAVWLRKNRIRPQQVQDFYPTPGTVSTCMYYTGLDPFSLQPVHVARTADEKAMQRALLQPHLAANRALARKALAKAGRGDLIESLVGASGGRKGEADSTEQRGNKAGGVKGHKAKAGTAATVRQNGNGKTAGRGGSGGKWREKQQSSGKKRKR